MSIDKRLDALVMNAEMQLREIMPFVRPRQCIIKDLETDSENIRALARIAEGSR